MSDSIVNETKLSELKLNFFTLVDDEALHSYIDSVIEKCQDRWCDMKQDYNSFSEYVLDEFDVEYLFDSGIIEIGTEFLKVDEDGKEYH